MNLRRPLALVLILLFTSPIIYLGCASRATGGSAEPEVYEPPPLEEPEVQDAPAQKPQVYDLEAEMPEQDDVEPEEYEESIKPVPADTVRIEEVVVPPSPEEVFGIGYRIQVFASNERASAERMKAKLEGETSLPVYIEYEGGYYKVRIGDFSSREEAAAERAKISAYYPDCWIVSTTIRK